MHPPKIFISATSGDLRSIRQIVKEALLTINCHPVEQTNFEPDARTVENMLRGKISDCQALIHICGMRYGAEPDVATLPPGTPRRSYTQMEYHIGRQLQEERGDDHFRVYTFICPDAFPYDPEPDTELQEKRDLQKAHRSRLFDDPHLREKPRDGDDLKLRILALQEHILALKHEQAEVKTEVIKNRHLGLKAFALLLLLLGGIYGSMSLMRRGQKSLEQGQDKLLILTQPKPLDKAQLRTYLIEASEKARNRELEIALTYKTDWKKRHQLTAEAEKSHSLRLSRVEQLTEEFAALDSGENSSPTLTEMLRILGEEGIEAALEYVESQSGVLIQKALIKLNTARSDLQPLLSGAQIAIANGQPAKAEALFKKLLDPDIPNWPEARHAYVDYLLYIKGPRLENLEQRGLEGLIILAMLLSDSDGNESVENSLPLKTTESIGYYHEENNPMLENKTPSLDVYQEANEHSYILTVQDPQNIQWQLSYAATLDRMASYYEHSGNINKAEKFYQSSLNVYKKIAAANPSNASLRKRLAKSYDTLGDIAAYQQNFLKAQEFYSYSIGILKDGSSYESSIKLPQLKAQNILIPRMIAEDIYLEEAIDFLRLRSIELDVSEQDFAKKGVHFIVRRPNSKYLKDYNKPTVIKSIDFNNVPLLIALKCICAADKMRLIVDDRALTIIPIKIDDSEVRFYTETYDIPSGFFSKLASYKNFDSKNIYLETEILSNIGILFPRGAWAKQLPNQDKLVVYNNYISHKRVKQLIFTVSK